jgi:hypothetical protein
MLVRCSYRFAGLITGGSNKSGLMQMEGAHAPAARPWTEKNKEERDNEAESGLAGPV